MNAGREAAPDPAPTPEGLAEAGTSWEDSGQGDGGGVARLADLTAYTWPEGGGWSCSVQDDGPSPEPLCAFHGCRDRGEASLAAAMWALGYLAGRAAGTLPPGKE